MTTTYIPPLRKPRLSSTYGLKLLASAPFVKQYQPHFHSAIDPDKPLRKSMIAPTDNGTFVKAIKQSFIKNPRLSSTTRIMLTLLAGWAGKGGSIETTTGIIGIHLSRNRRTVYRLLKDAEEEGYLYYTRTKDIIGRFTGIKIFLNFGAIRFNSFRGAKQKPVENNAPRRETFSSDTNSKYLYNKEEDQEIWERLTKLAHTMGFLDEKKAPT